MTVVLTQPCLSLGQVETTGGESLRVSPGVLTCAAALSGPRLAGKDQFRKETVILKGRREEATGQS